MKWLQIIGITVCIVLITLYEWPKIDRNQKKEKFAFLTLTTIGWLLAILLLFFPNMPSYILIIEKVFKPLSTMLETYKGT